MTNEKKIIAAAEEYCNRPRCATIQKGNKQWLRMKEAFKAGAEFGQALEREKAAGLVEALKWIRERISSDYRGPPWAIADMRDKISMELSKYESVGSG